MMLFIINVSHGHIFFTQGVELFLEVVDDLAANPIPGRPPPRVTFLGTCSHIVGAKPPPYKIYIIL